MKKVPKKRLGLDREVVATLVSELTMAKLRQVAGAIGPQPDPHTGGLSCPVYMT